MVLKTHTFGPLKNPVQPRHAALGVHRAVFLDSLAPHVDPLRTHFNKRCVSLGIPHSGGPVTIGFSDGTEVTADVVLGADGVRSAVRSYVVDGPKARKTENGHLDIARAVFTGFLAYRGLVSVAELKEKGMQLDLTTHVHGLCASGKACF